VKADRKPADHPALEPDYSAEVALRLIRELAHGPLGFQDLVKASEGAYPSDVLTALHQLETENQVHLSSGGLWTCCNQSDTTTKTTSHLGRETKELPDGLPEPHPLDFDWRFTQATLADLRMHINAAPSESIAILGAPTFYKYLIDSGVSAWLFDKNPHVVQHLRAEGYPSVIECDLLQFSAGSTQFQWAVADPPWYIEHYQAFLDAGRKILVPEGKLFLSVLPRLTRPSAPADRFHILECAMNLGFDLIEINAAALHYVSPPFETEALRAEGLVIGDWRTGDLFSFVMRSHKPQRSRPTTPNGNEQWQPVQLGKTTIKIKLELWTEGAPFSYEPVSPSGSVRLRSVSRRSPVRSRINVWTSRNVALRVSRP
jgi:hypothetical protein